jgi:hypothetical protein
MLIRLPIFQDYYRLRSIVIFSRFTVHFTHRHNKRQPTVNLLMFMLFLLNNAMNFFWFFFSMIIFHKVYSSTPPLVAAPNRQTFTTGFNPNMINVKCFVHFFFNLKILYYNKYNILKSFIKCYFFPRDLCVHFTNHARNFHANWTTTPTDRHENLTFLLNLIRH